MIVRLLVLTCVAVFSLAACSSRNDSDNPAGREEPLVFQTTRETYLTGPEFCDLYSKVTSKEVGIHVSVPKFYDHPELGSLSLYAYTIKPFDAAKPSYIYFDGGPGQNTHGMMLDFFGASGRTSMNEIYFDQRGLGCSSPATWDEYKDASLYSSRNNVRDADEIRKAYGVAKWTVYGVSYGTVPATMYGSEFASSTTSVVLEGVVGDTSMIGDAAYKAGKLNLVLARLTDPQRNGFAKLMTDVDGRGDRSADSRAFRTYMMQFFYADKGMSKFTEKVAVFIDQDGNIRRDKLAELRQHMLDRARKYPRAQQPGAVDGQILNVIYCKDLGARHHDSQGVGYSPSNGFYPQTYNGDANQYCDEVGVSLEDEQLFNPADFKTNVPVYYFQGAHDGATVAKGALANWQNVPQAKSYFLLAEKGGHNPNLSRIDSEDKNIGLLETALFAKAIRGEDISQADVAAINLAETSDEAWKLYLSKDDALNIASEFEGITLTH